MKIAVTYENGKIFQHFGHTEEFKIYTIQDKAIASSEVVSTNGSGHGALAGFLKGLGIDTLICGGIGKGAKDALNDVGITLYGGASGDADEAVSALLKDELEFNENVECSHHNDNGHEHSCGSHGCGSHGSKKYGGITEVTGENFSEEVKGCSDLVVIDFWAEWCGPCQMLSPIIDELSEEITDVKFCKINVDEQQDVAAKFDIYSIPTVIFIKNGEAVDKSIGFVQKEELFERIEKNK